MIEIVFLVALTTLGLAGFFRVLPWPAAWLQSPHWAMQKLWYCAICASGRAAPFALLIWLEDWPGWKMGIGLYFATTGLAALGYAYLFPPVIDLPLPGGES